MWRRFVIGFLGLFLASLFPASLMTGDRPTEGAPGSGAAGGPAEVIDLFDVVQDIALDPDGSIYATGTSSGGWDWNSTAITVKINPSGNIEWIKKVSNDGGLMLELDAEANIYVVMGQNLVKYDRLGHEKWRVPHNCAIYYGDLYVDPSGYSYIVHARGAVKFDPSGVEQWRGEYYDQGWNGVFCHIAVDPAGNVYAVGAVQGGPGCCGLIVKFDSTGGVAWHDNWGVCGNYSDNVLIDQEGNIVATGQVSDGAMTKKYTPAGVKIWESGSHRMDTGQGLGLDAAGNIYIMAVYSQYHQTVIKYDPSGIEQWITSLPIINRTLLYHDQNKDVMSVSPDGDVYVMGNNAQNDVALAKCNTLGELEWVSQHHEATYPDAYPMVVATDAQENAYIGGWLISDVDIDGFVLKFDPAGTEAWLALIKTKGYPCGDPSIWIQGLIDRVVSLNLAKGMVGNLDGKLEAALKALGDLNQNNDAAVCGAMAAFITICDAQKGKGLTVEEADSLIAQAQWVKNCLGCR